jgi:hypothetical protein
MTLTQSIAETVLPALATLVGTVVTVAVPLFVKMAFDRMAAKTKNEKLSGVLERLGEASAKAVRDVSATVVPQLEKSAADGKFTAGERQVLKDAAVDKVKTLIGAVGIKEACAILGYDSPEQMAERLRAEIEAAVSDMKIEKEAVKAAAPVVNIAS